MSEAKGEAESPGGLEGRLVSRRARGFELAIELSIEAGQTVALLGPNGAGKSTTTQLLAGLLALDDGFITLGDELLDSPAAGVFVPAEQRRVGTVFQDFLLFEHLSAIDNVAFGLAAAGQKRAPARVQAAEWLGAVGVADLADRRPSQLSGGQAQRVALARTLAARPAVLLLDEPLAALDIETRSVARRFLAQHLKAFEGPRLLITHDPTDAMLLADRIVVIEKGRVTQEGSPADIRRRPATSYVAALAGTNLLEGTNRAGTLTVDERQPLLATDDTTITGPVLITIHPRAVALHRERPEGSPRNTWSTTVVGIEDLGDIVRVQLGQPFPILADITPGGASALRLTAGSEVWVAVKATEVQVAPV
ncbi:MAG: molybdate transport system ATP-binding protein [Acidimicrobiales bacterium]|jgi:molybdate transport system ATP-binding protein